MIQFYSMSDVVLLFCFNLIIVSSAIFIFLKCFEKIFDILIKVEQLNQEREKNNEWQPE